MCPSAGIRPSLWSSAGDAEIFAVCPAFKLWMSVWYQTEGGSCWVIAILTTALSWAQDGSDLWQQHRMADSPQPNYSVKFGREESGLKCGCENKEETKERQEWAWLAYYQYGLLDWRSVCHIFHAASVDLFPCSSWYLTSPFISSTLCHFFLSPPSLWLYIFYYSLLVTLITPYNALIASPTPMCCNMRQSIAV